MLEALGADSGAEAQTGDADADPGELVGDADDAGAVSCIFFSIALCSLRLCVECMGRFWLECGLTSVARTIAALRQ